MLSSYYGLLGLHCSRYYFHSFHTHVGLLQKPISHLNCMNNKVVSFQKRRLKFGSESNTCRFFACHRIVLGTTCILLCALFLICTQCQAFTPEQFMRQPSLGVKILSKRGESYNRRNTVDSFAFRTLEATIP